jgi:competence protein ComGC
MVLSFRIIAGIFGAVATLCFKFSHNYTGTFMVVLVIISLLLSLFLNNTVSPKKHEKEQRLIFEASLKIIKRRVGITLDQLGKFKELFDSHKYFLKPEQEQTITDLISDLRTVKMLDEEIKPHSAITKEQRKEYIRERRILLDRIENIEATIEKFLRNLT